MPTLERYAQVADYLGVTEAPNEEKSDGLIAKIDELKEKVVMKNTIANYGIDEQIFLASPNDMVEQAFDDQCAGANPRYPLMSEIKQVYLNAYYGRKFTEVAMPGEMQFGNNTKCNNCND